MASEMWLLMVALSMTVEVMVAELGDFSLAGRGGNVAVVPVKLMVIGIGQRFQTKLLLVVLIVLRSNDLLALLAVLGKKMLK